jgi:hypothetical protein
MSAPVWNGRGRDPWLPHRLAARTGIAQHERAIRQGIWAALSSWLVGTARRVLRGATLPPDLDVVWARAPEWRSAVDKVVKGEIREAMGAAYEPLFGPSFPWEQRPAAATYLAEVENRLVRIPDEVYDLAAEQVQEAIGLGEGIPGIADRVDNVLSTTASERWPNRATVIARTEAVGALNAGRNDAFKGAEQAAGTDMVKVWLATEDSRTRPSHREADGQRVPMGANFTVGGFSLAFPGDPSGPPAEVIQCRCTMLLMEPDEDVDLSDRQLRRL